MHSSTLILSLLATVACAATSIDPQTTSLALLSDADSDSDVDDSEPVSFADITATLLVASITDTSIYTAAPLKLSITKPWNMSSGTGVSLSNFTATGGTGTGTGIGSNVTSTAGPFSNSTVSLKPIAFTNNDVGTVIITATGSPSRPVVITSIAVVTGTITQPTLVSSPTASLAGANGGKPVSFAALFVALLGLSVLFVS